MHLSNSQKIRVSAIYFPADFHLQGVKSARCTPAYPTSTAELCPLWFETGSTIDHSWNPWEPRPATCLVHQEPLNWHYAYLNELGT